MPSIESTTPALNSSDDQVSWILREFEFYDGVYKRSAVEAAIQRREEITPHLLAILEDVIKNPPKYADKNLKYHSGFYAAILLSHFKEPKAHALFLEAFSLPGEIFHPIFDEFDPENLQIFLYQTYSGNIEVMKKVIQNQQANPHCRSAAAKGLVYCVAEGLADRQDVLMFLAGLFSAEINASEENEFLSSVASCLNDLFPKSVMDVIHGAFEKGLICRWMISEMDFDYTLETSSPERCLQVMRKELKERTGKNLHRFSQERACFNVRTPHPARDKYKSAQNFSEAGPSNSPASMQRLEPRASRNDPCPCGSKKKYKKCCLH
jgi:hypothetical protein